jgi:hypothetical protein
MRAGLFLVRRDKIWIDPVDFAASPNHGIEPTTFGHFGQISAKGIEIGRFAFAGLCRTATTTAVRTATTTTVRTSATRALWLRGGATACSTRGTGGGAPLAEYAHHTGFDLFERYPQHIEYTGRYPSPLRINP